MRQIMAGVRDQLAAIRFLYDAADGGKFRGHGNSSTQTGTAATADRTRIKAIAVAK
jgi:hypothetical protein